MAESRLFAQFDNLKNIDVVQAALPGAHVLRNAAYANYQSQTDEDAFEDEFMYEEADGGAMVICREEFPISFIEYGTAKMSAQPFMRPAIDNNQDTIAEAIGKNVTEQIRLLVG
jgi:HK97 gp10 family phage protein